MITEIKKDKIYQTVKKIINQLHIFDLRGTSSSVFNSVCKKLGVCCIKEISNQTENELLSFRNKEAMNGVGVGKRLLLQEKPVVASEQLQLTSSSQ
jgi:hypothetical protein